MAKPTQRKRNPTDITLRNARAGLARDRVFRAQIVRLTTRLTRLEAMVRVLRDAVSHC